MALLMTATAVWFIAHAARQKAPAPTAPGSMFDATPTPAPLPTSPSDESSPPTASELPSLPMPVPMAASTAPTPQVDTAPRPTDLPPPSSSEANSPVQTAPQASTGEANPASIVAVTADDWLKSLDELLKLPPTPAASTGTAASPPHAHAPGSAPPAAPAPIPPPSASASAPGVASAKWGEIVPARRREQPDGSILYDERFALTGQGTTDNPYVVNWDFLVSASETYQPRLGKNRLPERITILDGKHVRVVGYVAFPILSTSPNEMLSMRNMWDGCCIGIPPTPYDAIEVRLKDAASPAQRLMRFGSVEGKLSVDPYIKGNWLLGLYVMDDAKVSEAKNAGL